MVVDDRERWFHLRVEDYRSAWNEVLAGMSQQQSVLSLGTAAEAVVIAATFTQWHHRPQFALLALLVDPSIALLTVALWASEAARMSRAERYVAAVEAQIAREFAGSGLPAPMQFVNWKHRPLGVAPPSDNALPSPNRRAQRRHSNQLPWTYVGVAAALLPLALGILIAGLIHSHLPWWGTLLAAVGNVVLLLGVVVFMRLALDSRRLLELPGEVPAAQMVSLPGWPPNTP